MDKPQNPKIYHILHIDKLSSILTDNGLFCDAEIVKRPRSGTSIGMNTIKRRRLQELPLTCNPQLFVGDCVPFYFCPRSIMLYMIYQANHPDLSYRGGQEPIIHLEADLMNTVAWAEKNQKKWAFTLSNAGSYYFEDRNQLASLDEIDWASVFARNWQDCKEGKQAEFLLEKFFPWSLVETIGVFSDQWVAQVREVVGKGFHRPAIQIRPDWYY